MSDPTYAASFDPQIGVDDAMYVMHTYGRKPIQFVGGHGATLVDSTGKEYLDLLAGIGCASLGHGNPVVAEALKAQVDTGVWQVSNYYYIQNRNELAQMISALLSTTTDESGHTMGSTGTIWRSFFCGSGTEATEGAIKLARRWGEVELDGAYGIITAKQSFHGRTMGALSATGQDKFHDSFRPMLPGFAHVPLNDLAALRQAIEQPSEATGPVCAVMLECVQGEGGVWNADYDYLADVRDLCDEHHVLLVIDEVQTGFFRCGSPFCYQRSGIEPDIVAMAKGIADGFPMGAFAARSEVADLMRPGDHGSTFGGNALACAAGRACVRELIDSDMGEHVITTGWRLRRRLMRMDHVVEVRGHGLMRGVQLDLPIAQEIVESGLHEGLVMNNIGKSILRFLPPLVITKDQIDEACDKVEYLLGRLS